MNDRKVRPAVWIAVLGSLALLAVLVVMLEARRQPPPSAGEFALPETAAMPEEAVAPATAPKQDDRSREPRPAAQAAGQQEPVPYIDGLVYGEIDLREAR